MRPSSRPSRPSPTSRPRRRTRATRRSLTPSDGRWPADAKKGTVPLFASGRALRLVLAQVALEQAAVLLLVAQDGDDHVVGDGVDALGLLDDEVVVLDRAGLGLDHALDHVDDVGLVV